VFMNEKTTQVLSVSAAMLVGALIGAGVGILTAPMSGEETRSLIRDRSREIEERVSEAVVGTRDRLGRALEDITMSTKERIPVFRNRAQQMVGEATEKVIKN